MTFSRPQRLKGTIVRYPHPFLRYPTLPLLLILRARLLQKPPSGLIWFQIHLFITKVKLFKCTCLWQRQNTKFFFLRNKAVFLNEVKLYQDVIISSVVIKKQSIAQLLRGPHLGLINKNKPLLELFHLKLSSQQIPTSTVSKMAHYIMREVTIPKDDDD